MGLFSGKFILLSVGHNTCCIKYTIRLQFCKYSCVHVSVRQGGKQRWTTTARCLKHAWELENLVLKLSSWFLKSFPADLVFDSFSLNSLKVYCTKGDWRRLRLPWSLPLRGVISWQQQLNMSFGSVFCLWILLLTTSWFSRSPMVYLVTSMLTPVCAWTCSLLNLNKTWFKIGLEVCCFISVLVRPLKHALAKIFICSRMLTALLYLQTLENSVHGDVLMLGSCNKRFLCILAYTTGHLWEVAQIVSSLLLKV